jgi:hypothetical protein
VAKHKKQVKRPNLPDDHRVARRCGFQRLLRNPDTQEVIGIVPQALFLRTEKREQYLSSSWFEFHKGADAERLKAVLDIYRKGGDTPGPNSAIALLHVGKILAAGRDGNHQIRVTHRGNARDPAYAPIEGVPLDNSDLVLLKTICDQACCGVHTVGAIDAL